MRMPWPFRLFQRAPVPRGAASGAGRVAAERRNEWRNLPPIAETVGPPPLIAPSAPFAAHLGAGHPPPPVLAPLGHGRGLDAPSGIVVGVAKPVQRAAQVGARPLVQRRPNIRGAAETALPQLEPAVAAEPSAGPAVADQPAHSEESVRPRRLPASVPVQRPPLKLARLSDGDRGAFGPARAVGVIGQPTTGGRTRATSPSSVPLPSPPAAPATSPGPSTPAPPSAGASATRPASAAPLAGPISRKPADARSARASTPAAAPTRLTLGQSRKVGLGAPLTATPATAAPIGVTERESALPLPSRAEVQRKPEAEVARETIPATPVRARPIDGSSGEPAPTATRSSMPSTPLLAARPLRTRVQRAPMTATRSRPVREGADSDDRGAPVSGAPVKVHRGTIASELAGSLDARAFTYQGEIYLPSSAGQMGSPAARALIAHEMTHVVQQRAYGSRLPQEHTSHGQDLERRAAAAERQPNMALAVGARSGHEHSDAPSDLESAQRKPDNRSSPVVETSTINFQQPTQRAPADKPRATAPEMADEASRKRSETELEELAGQLYGRISRRLRRELLIDRERAGVMVDLR